MAIRVIAGLVKHCGHEGWMLNEPHACPMFRNPVERCCVIVSQSTGVSQFRGGTTHDCDWGFGINHRKEYCEPEVRSSETSTTQQLCMEDLSKQPQRSSDDCTGLRSSSRATELHAPETYLPSAAAKHVCMSEFSATSSKI